MLAGMTTGASMAEVAALVGDPARANILDTLIDGRALTATELAFVARVSPSTASAHLAKLTEARLLSVVRQGRHRYYRLASPLVGRMLEGIMAVAAIEGPPRYRPRSARDEAMRLARSCYDHLAGCLGVAIADALAARGHIVLDDEGGEVTEAGAAFLDDLGIALADARKTRRPFCKPCLDWSERRPHIAGVLGAALLTRALELGWVARVRDTRAIAITPRGRAVYEASFGIDIAALAASAARHARVAA
jgi:DNA-binding transcriptional ArsR family regulator